MMKEFTLNFSNGSLNSQQQEQQPPHSSFRDLADTNDDDDDTSGNGGTRRPSTSTLMHEDTEMLNSVIDNALHMDVVSPHPSDAPSDFLSLGVAGSSAAGGGTGGGGANARAKSERRWDKILQAVFDKPTATEYAILLTKHKITPIKPMILNNEDFREVGIPLGHRKVLTEVMVRMRAAHESEQEPDNSMHLSLNNTRFGKAGSFSALNPMCISYEFKCGLRWRDYEGESDSYEGFLKFVEYGILQKGSADEFPSGFIRAFWDNKPMPYTMKAHNRYGRTAMVILLRLPSRELVADPGNVKDSIMATMTNRFILMYQPRGMQHGELITYHKDPSSSLPWLEEIKHNVSDFLADFSRENIVLHLLTESMHTTKHVLDAYRTQLETLQDVNVSQSPTAVVEWMNLIGRQAQVLKRCLSRDADAITEFVEVMSLKSHSTIQAVTDMLQSAEEIESNAYDAMQLRMGLVGFRSQENMKLFTFISALTSPLAVLTGWYGMNFDAMSELHDPDAYNIFIGFAAATVICLLGLMRYLHRESAHGAVNAELRAIVTQDTQHSSMSYVGRMKRDSAVSTPSNMADDVTSDQDQQGGGNNNNVTGSGNAFTLVVEPPLPPLLNVPGSKM
eukprot:PhF_6_TR33716/c0_g1_i1/m.49486